MDNIKLPEDMTDLRTIKADFFNIAQFPNCVGAVDGTLIPIKGMSGAQEYAYVCRKNFHALNIQAVADSNLRFLHINTFYPGAAHDAYVIANYALPERIQRLPEGGWLLGDSAYPLKEWLLTPFFSPSNQQEEKYNIAHGKTRAVIERAFGVLKSRFRCLHRSGGVLPFSPKKCSSVIETCFRLHNKAIAERVPLRQGGQVHNYSCNTAFQGNAQPSAQQIRQKLVTLF